MRIRDIAIAGCAISIHDQEIAKGNEQLVASVFQRGGRVGLSKKVLTLEESRDGNPGGVADERRCKEQR